jgi:lipoate-protein ligase A
MTMMLEDTTSPSLRTSGEVLEDRTAQAKARLARMLAEEDFGRIEWEQPSPSAAFSRRDTFSPGFAAAVDQVRQHGFTPFIRPVGGRLAAYHGESLVLDLLLRTTDPHPGTTPRFRAVAQALTQGLRTLGVDARVGEVPGEYCPGDWSVNSAGRRKLVGTGQRLVRNAVLFTAVIVVGDPDPLREVMTDAYQQLGFELDPATVGSIRDDVPGVSLAEVREVLTDALAAHIPVGYPDSAGTSRLLGPWDPR